MAINAFPDDFASEHEAVRSISAEFGVRSAVCTRFGQGDKGAIDLSEAVAEAANEPSPFHFLYPSCRSAWRR